MKVIRQLAPVNSLSQGRTILTIGSYDGVHRGHRRLLSNLKEAALSQAAAAALITFYPRPKAVLAPHTKADYLTTVDEKITIFEQLGLDIVAIIPFTLEFARTPAQDFMRQVVDVFHPLELWVGADFRLGKDRAGDVDFLRALGRELDYTIHVIDLEQDDRERISSTRIRDAMAAGQIREVTDLLGDYPFLQGSVVEGARRGHTIGFPTANVQVDAEKLLPANGVYAVWIHVDGQVHPAVANIGVRPTFEETTKTIEVHIFDFDRNIYGRPVRVDLVDYLRPEQKFSGLEALITQIGRDARRAGEILAVESKPTGKLS
jgi:riboflavin kinase/FMN adenylyltransferase